MKKAFKPIHKPTPKIYEGTTIEFIFTEEGIIIERDDKVDEYLFSPYTGKTLPTDKEFKEYRREFTMSKFFERWKPEMFPTSRTLMGLSKSIDDGGVEILLDIYPDWTMQGWVMDNSIWEDPIPFDLEVAEREFKRKAQNVIYGLRTILEREY